MPGYANSVGAISFCGRTTVSRDTNSDNDEGRLDIIDDNNITIAKEEKEVIQMAGDGKGTSKGSGSYTGTGRYGSGSKGGGSRGIAKNYGNSSGSKGSSKGGSKSGSKGK